MRSYRGYNAIYAPRGMSFPNSLQPAPGATALTYEQWCSGLEDEGVNLLRVRFCGEQNALNQGAPGFEYEVGQYTDWDGRLLRFLDACRMHGIQLQAIPFSRGEIRDDHWPEHAWHTNNGGWLTDAREVFYDPVALSAAKARIDAIVQVAGDVIGAWELFAEMSWICAPDFWQVSSWAEMRPIVYDILIPWVEAMLQHIKSQHAAPAGNGQIFVGTAGPSWPDTVPELRNEIYRTPSADCAYTNWYGGTLEERVRWLRACQAYTGKPVRIEQYAPWDSGSSYEREPPDLSWSKAHEWAAVCGGSGCVGPMRWPEIWPRGEMEQWWGIAHPNMAEIAGVTAQYAATVRPEDWDMEGTNWDEQITSPDLDFASSWSDGERVTAYLQWQRSDMHDVEVVLAGGEYLVRTFDVVSGQEAETWEAVTDNGVLFLDNVPSLDGRAVLYVEPVEPVQPAERTMRVTLQEMEGDELVSAWAGTLEQVA